MPGQLTSPCQSAREQHAKEVGDGKRFEFGKNWQKLLPALDEERIVIAERSLRKMLGCTDLHGRRFLDIGSGTGLFSLAARRLGARVHSFDFDPHSVACTLRLQEHHFPDDRQWHIEQGSVLDPEYLGGLGQFDVVYSWGVLHHTGALWQALANAAPLVAKNGQLFLSIYNDQGKTSRRWWWIKRLYNGLPRGLRALMLPPVFAYLYGWTICKDCVRGRPFGLWQRYKQANRGMSLWRDLVDWVGGFPFEVAKPEEVFAFFFQRGFALTRLHTEGGNLGCNEFVFRNLGAHENEFANAGI
jgi:2-polyprenyl-3-methyl-5-hydroxy-6-metoxy-1,4-benzoquinol methylase